MNSLPADMYGFKTLGCVRQKQILAIIVALYELFSCSFTYLLN